MMKGITASPGIAIGKAHIFIQQDIKISDVKIAKENVTAELEKLHLAIKVSKEQIQNIKTKAILDLGESEAEIFEAHLLILEDPEFVGQIKKGIENQQENASYATQKI